MSNGMFECFHCGERAVIWGGDNTFEEYGMEGEGVVQNLHCSNCGAEILYFIDLNEEKEDGETSGRNENDNRGEAEGTQGPEGSDQQRD